MGHNTSSAASADVREWLESAQNSPRGIKIGPFSSEGETKRQRQRIYTWRVSDRNESKKVYEPTHAMHGRSPYDGLTVDIDGLHLLIKKVSTEGITVEEL